MGNCGSSAGTIRVHTQKPTYRAGDQVSGDVYVFIQSPINSDGVFLRFRGKERYMFIREESRTVRDGDNSTSQEYRDRTYTDEKEFFEVLIPLMPAAYGKMDSGQFQIPFNFVLPPTLPGSFEAASPGGYRTYDCAVEYELKAYISVPGVFSSDIKHVQKLAISPSGDLRQPILPETVERNISVRLCCCIPRGKVWLRAHLEKDGYLPGETAEVLLEAQNSSDSIKGIDLRLIRSLTLGKASYDNLVQIDTLIERNYPGVRSGEECTGPSGRRSLSVPLVSSNAMPLQPDVNGAIIQCAYYLDVVARFNYNPSIELKLPIHILSSPPPPPIDWSPLPPEANEMASMWSPMLLDPVSVTPSAPPMPQ